MITFTVALAALIAGYFIYGKFVSRVFGVDPKRATPAYTKQDGVDYIPMPAWKIFMIQFLNIAGLGPIFGAIMGAKFGTASYLWIVLGSIFAGAVHDFLSGMISLRNDGESLPETDRPIPRKPVQAVHAGLLGAADGTGRRRIRGRTGRPARQADAGQSRSDVLGDRRIRLLRTGHAGCRSTRSSARSIRCSPSH